MIETWKKEQVTDLVNLILGAILFFSPWFLGFTAETAATWNAWISGAVIAGLAVAALASFAEWEEWVNLIAGIWVAVSPWLIGFSAIAAAMQLHLAIGIIVALIAAVRIWLEHNNQPRVTA